MSLNNGTAREINEKAIIEESNRFKLSTKDTVTIIVAMG